MPASGGTYRRRVKILQVGYNESHHKDTWLFPSGQDK